MTKKTQRINLSDDWVALKNPSNLESLVSTVTRHRESQQEGWFVGKAVVVMEAAITFI